MKTVKISLWEALRRGIEMAVRAAPTELRSLIILALIGGAGPAATLFLNKLVLDEASRLVGEGLAVDPFKTLWAEPLLLWGMVGSIALNLLVDSLNPIANFVFSSLRDRVRGFAQGIILEKIANFQDIALFESPELLNLVKLTEKGVDRLKELSFILVTTLNGIFTFIPAVFISLTLASWIPLVLCACTAPSIYIELKYRKASWEVEETQASLTRNLDLHKNILTGRDYGKELRLLSLQPFLLKQWHNLFDTLIQSMQQVRSQGTSSVLAWSAIGGLGVALPYLYVVLGALRGIYTLGDLALYAGLIVQVRRSLFILINNGSDLYEVVLGIRPIFQLLALKPKLSLLLPASPVIESQPDSDFEGMIVQDLSFSYPGSDREILKNISLKVSPQETIAFVGENGAGKTTLAKLLCRFYDPNRGKICWQGRDLRTIPLQDWWDKIAIVLQDFARFPLTLRENAGFGNLALLDDDLAIEIALNSVGINVMNGQFFQGLETPLGTELEAGIELSEGQWQRLAIARALLRLPAAELLIFDEPTAAIDAQTEWEFYQRFRQIARHKMAVIISHRLAMTKLADRIVVLEKGRIVEVGTHEGLMAVRGRYYRLFNRQASSYSIQLNQNDSGTQAP